MNNNLYVGNLPYSLEKEDLQRFFEEVGPVNSAHIIKDKTSGRSKGFGFVEMSSEEDARKARELFNGKELGGRNIIINEAQPKKKEF